MLGLAFILNAVLFIIFMWGGVLPYWKEFENWEKRNAVIIALMPLSAAILILIYILRN
jgi:hypothetical protein